MNEQVKTGASNLRKRYWQEHGKPPEGEGPHPDRPVFIHWLELLVAQLEADRDRANLIIATLLNESLGGE